jgi:hypothetical protein
MQYKTFPWNQWIDLLRNGDAVPFFEGVKKAVYAGFRGMKASEVRRQYGDEAQDDVAQLLALKLLRANVITEFKKKKWDDGHIAAYIMKAIKQTIWDLASKRSRENAIFSPLSDATVAEDRPDGDAVRAAHAAADPRPSPAAKLEGKEVSSLLNRVTAQFTPRQVRILQDYKPFGGEMRGPELAVALKVSIQTINNEVSTIKRLIRAAALENGYAPAPTAGNGSDD